MSCPESMLLQLSIRWLQYESRLTRRAEYWDKNKYIVQVRCGEDKEREKLKEIYMNLSKESMLD